MGLGGLDVIEGCREDEGGACLENTMQPASEIIAAGKELRSQTKALAKRAAFDDRYKKIWAWLGSQSGGATKNQVSLATGINHKLTGEAIESLLETGSIESCEVLTANGQKCRLPSNS